MLQLLLRGESPSSIRTIDIRPPQVTRLARLQRALDNSTRDQLILSCEKIGFFRTNITNESALLSAFSAPWDDSVARQPLTVFMTVAVIRHWERCTNFLPLSTNINTVGTQNVVAAARKAGADVLIATSSGSVLMKPMALWLAPWQTELQDSAQIIDGKRQGLPDEHGAYAGNYPYSKALAEKLVRQENDPEQGFRTGLIRPCNGVYGSGGDAVACAFLEKGGFVT